jgi:hypothetical protein
MTGIKLRLLGRKINHRWQNWKLRNAPTEDWVGRRLTENGSVDANRIESTELKLRHPA